jgi:hypothetical protein
VSHLDSDGHRFNVRADRSHTNIPVATDEPNIHTNRDNPSPSRTAPDNRSSNVPETSVLLNMESYASIELGVAKLEIMYQENLKCIAMTSDGCRCQEIIREEQLRKAQELLSLSITSEAELDINRLPQLVLCHGHALGQLPRIYSEKWAISSEQRLSKEEAMSKFNANVWMSVQFFPNERRARSPSTTNINRPRSPRHISAASSRRKLAASKQAHPPE